MTSTDLIFGLYVTTVFGVPFVTIKFVCSVPVENAGVISVEVECLLVERFLPWRLFGKRAMEWSVFSMSVYWVTPRSASDAILAVVRFRSLLWAFPRLETRRRRFAGCDVLFSEGIVAGAIKEELSAGSGEVDPSSRIVALLPVSATTSLETFIFTTLLVDSSCLYNELKLPSLAFSADVPVGVVELFAKATLSSAALLVATFKFVVILISELVVSFNSY